MPFGSTTGSFSLPIIVWNDETVEDLSAMTFFIMTPSPISVPRMMTQPESCAPFLMRTSEEMMQLSISPSIMQPSATRQFFAVEPSA